MRVSSTYFFQLSSLCNFVSSIGELSSLIRACITSYYFENQCLVQGDKYIASYSLNQDSQFLSRHALLSELEGNQPTSLSTVLARQAG